MLLLKKCHKTTTMNNEHIFISLKDEYNSEVISHVIEKHLQFYTFVENNINNALFILNNFAYEFVICDFDYGGVELYKHALPQSFLFLSAKKYNFFTEHSVPYLLKPYRIKDILSLTKKHMGQIPWPKTI